MGTSLILAEAGASKYVVASSLLINSAKFDSVNSASLHHEFGDDVVNLVREVQSFMFVCMCTCLLVCVYVSYLYWAILA